MGIVRQFAIQTGIDEGANPKALPPGTLKTGHNVRFDKAGRLSKRFGTDILGSAITIAVRRLMVRGDELCAVCVANSENATLRVYSSISDTWRNADRVQDVGLSWTTLLDDQAGVRSSDFAIGGASSNVLFHAWVTGNPGIETTGSEITGLLWFQAIDTTDGSVIKTPVRVASSVSNISMVRLLRLGGFVFVLYSYDNAANGNIAYEAFNETTLALAATGTLVTDQNESSPVAYTPFDATVDEGIARIIVIYEDDLNNVHLELYSQTAGTISASLATRIVNTAASDEIKCMSVVTATSGGSTTNVFAAFSPAAGANGTDLLVSHCTATAAAFSANVFTEQIVEAGAGLADVDQVGMVQVSATKVSIAWTRGWDADFTADQGNPYTKTKSVTTGAVFSNEQTSAAMRLISKPFVKVLDNEAARRYFALVCDYPDRDVTESTLISSYLIEIYPEDSRNLHRYMGRIDTDIAGFTVTGSLPSVPGYGTLAGFAGVFAYFACPVPFQGVAAQEHDVVRCGLRWATVRFYPGQPPDMWRGVEVQRESVFAAGLLCSWDGRTAFDYGMRAPRLRALDDSTNGSIVAGTYTYQVVPAYYSHAGVKHRGPASVARSRSLAAGEDEVKLYLASHHLDGKQDTETGFGSNGLKQARFEIFRSVINLTTPQQLTYDPQFVPGVVWITPQDPKIVFSDKRADADITDGTVNAVALSSRPVIYTLSGELEDTQPPAPWTFCLHANRIFLISGSRREVFWSKDANENPGLAPGFNPTQRMLFDEDLTAVASMDDKLVVFSDARIWVVFGEGPNVNGEDNRFSVPRMIQSDVGCVNPRSVVSMPDGIMFESSRGLYLLSRGLELIWIGQAVRDTLATYAFITSAVLVAKHNEVRFTCNNADGYAATLGRVIVYDYVRKQWLTRSYTIGGTANVVITDSIVWMDAWVFATPTGTVVKETTGFLEEGTTFVPSTVRFSPVNGEGPLSWYRMKDIGIAGEAVSNHRLTFNIYRDYAAAVDQTKTFAEGSEVTTIGPFEQAKVDVKVQKGEAYELEIVDAAPVDTVTYPIGTGAGFRLEGIAFHMMPKEGMPRLSAGKRG